MSASQNWIWPFLEVLFNELNYSGLRNPQGDFSLILPQDVIRDRVIPYMYIWFLMFLLEDSYYTYKHCKHLSSSLHFLFCPPRLFISGHKKVDGEKKWIKIRYHFILVFKFFLHYNMNGCSQKPWKLIHWGIKSLWSYSQHCKSSSAGLLVCVFQLSIKKVQPACQTREHCLQKVTYWTYTYMYMYMSPCLTDLTYMYKNRFHWIN